MTISAPPRREDWEDSREIRLPFELRLENGVTLCCHEVLRVLPGRRVVCRATTGGQTVLAKIFLGKGSRKEARADARAIRAMMAAGIPTPALREVVPVLHRSHLVLLFEYVADARSFRSAWASSDATGRHRLLQRLLELVAAQHDAGLRQRDFHLSNFLVDAEGRVLAIDGGDFILSSRPLRRRTSIAGLGVLFGHLPRQVLHQAPGILEGYFRARGWSCTAADLRRTSRAADAFRHRRARRISRKSFRTCSEFVKRRKGRLRLYQRRDLPREALDAWVERSSLAPREGEEILKAGNSQTLWRTRLGNREVVVKRYNLKSRLHVLKRALGRSRASRAWANAHRLRAYHIDTPRPLAMIEERKGPFGARAWLLTEPATGQSALQYIQASPGEENLNRLADMVLSFGDNGLVHGDMKAANFLMDDHGLEVIDLDSMARPRIPLLRRTGIRQDRARFLRNWQGPLRARFRWLLERERPDVGSPRKTGESDFARMARMKEKRRGLSEK